MKTFIVLFTIILFSFVVGCKKEDSVSPKNSYTVSGTIYSGGHVVANATVSLGKQVNLTSQSDSSGRFAITNVPSNTYVLSVQKTNPDGSFLAKSSELMVTDDVYIQSLILPRGVVLLPITSVTATSMAVSWNPTDANDFREYKLYRHTTSGLDETTGLLAHVATAINDTQFVDDNLNPLTRYYYRVYVMNDYGHLGGSNITSAMTVNLNVASNGSFEAVTAPSTLPDYWTVWGASGRFSSDATNAQEGSKSLTLQLLLSDWGVNSWGIYQQIVPTKFEQGRTYQVSFWCKTDTLEQYESMSCHFATSMNYGTSSLVHLYDFVEGPQSAGGWSQFSFTFTAPTSVPANYYLIFDVIRAGTTGYVFHFPMTAWLDNVVIQKVP
jgi:hypothetical protein